MPTAATLSFISSAILAFSRLAAVYFSIGVPALAVVDAAVPVYVLSAATPPVLFLVAFSDWFKVVRYRGSGRVTDFPFFCACCDDCYCALPVVVLFEFEASPPIPEM